MIERLSVVYGTQIVATLQRKDDGTLELTYSDLAREIAEGRVLLSASLPVRREPYNSAELMPFFEGLLPEELVRQRLAVRLRIDAGDVFGFLREIGRECAGAFSIIPGGVDLVAAENAGVAWLSQDDLAEAIRDLAARPLGVEPGEDIRISLAGAQDKFVVVVADDRITHDMATSINGIYDGRGIPPVHWQKEFVRLGLRQRLYATRMNELADRVHEALPGAMAWIAEKGAQHRLIESIASLVTERLAVLRQVNHLPPPAAMPARAQRRDGGVSRLL